MGIDQRNHHLEMAALADMRDRHSSTTNPDSMLMDLEAMHGVQSAVNAMVQKNRGLAIFFARQFEPCTSIPMDDLIQEAMLGLLRAAHSFNPEKGTFATWASVSIERQLKWYIKSFERLIRLPEEKILALSSFFEAQVNFEDTYDRKPSTPEELAEFANVDSTMLRAWKTLEPFVDGTSAFPLNDHELPPLTAAPSVETLDDYEAKQMLGVFESYYLDRRRSLKGRTLSGDEARAHNANDWDAFCRHHGLMPDGAVESHTEIAKCYDVTRGTIQRRIEAVKARLAAHPELQFLAS